MIRNVLRAIFVFLMLVIPGLAMAQPIIIDSFTTNQSTLTLTFPPAGTTASSSVSGAGILPAAGERDLQVNLTAGVIAGNSVSGGVSSGLFSFSQGVTIAGNATIAWDGTDGSPTLNPTGLGGIDLTAGGSQDALLLNTFSDDLAINVTIEVFTDAGNASSLTLALPGLLFTPTNFVMPYSSFTPSLGAGATFSNVGAVTLTLGSPTTPPDVALDFLQTTSTLTACKAVTVINDVNGNGLADPGDTLEYTIVLDNPDDAFNAATTGVLFTNNAPLNTTLVNGSVTTTQGTVTTGNGGGDTSVAVNVGTIADAASATIVFRVTINSPLPAGVTQISCQGLVTSSDLTNLLTDDCSLPGPADPTTIPVTAAPAVAATKTAALVVDGNANGQVNPGDTIEYTIVITNSGNMNATGIAFTDTIDPNAALVVGSVTTTQGTVTLGNSGGDTSVAVNVGTVNGNGGTVTIKFRVTVDNPLAAGVTQIVNQGTVTGTNIPTTMTDDPGTPATDDPTATPVTAAPLVTATKSGALVVDGNANGQINPGDTIEYTIVITNSGNVNATGIAFTDTIDSNAALVVGSVTTTQGTVTLGNTAGNTSVAVNVGTINANGGTVTIKFRVTVDNPLAAGVTQITNQGTVTGTNIPTTMTDNPGTPAPGDPTGNPVTPVAVVITEVPTLNGAGLVALILALLAMAVVRLRRRAA